MHQEQLLELSARAIWMSHYPESRNLEVAISEVVEDNKHGFFFNFSFETSSGNQEYAMELPAFEALTQGQAHTAALWMMNSELNRCKI